MMVECLSRKRKFTEKIPLRHSSVFFVNVRKPSGLQLGVRACARLSLTREKRNLACLSRSSSRNWFARVHQDTANQSEIYIYIGNPKKRFFQTASHSHICSERNSSSNSPDPYGIFLSRKIWFYLGSRYETIKHE